MNRRTEALDDSISAIEKQVYGNPEGETPDATEPATETTETAEVQPDQPTEEVTAEAAPESEAEQQEEVADTGQPEEDKPKRENWKKRYTNYKASTDLSLHQLRQKENFQAQQILDLQRTLANLQESMNASKPAHNPLDTLSKEEREVIGDDAALSFQKMIDADREKTVKPIQAQLKAERDLRLKQEQHRLEQQRADDANQFMNKLLALAPDYETIDKDPKFIKWMDNVDPASGHPMTYLFKRAQTAGDVERVAHYFNTFSTLQNKGKEILEDRISPSKTSTNTTAVQNPKKPELVSIKEVMAFYDSKESDWKGREKLRQELDIKYDKAFREKRIAY